jgi:sugar phosphate isomerase/epimerase
LAAVGTGAGKVLHGLTLTDPDAEVRRKAIAFVADMMTFGARFGCPAIIGSMQGSMAQGVERFQALQWLEEALDTLGEHAEEFGVTLIFEPLNRYETNLLNTLGEGAALLDMLQTKNVKLLADLFHMNIEEQDLAATIRQLGVYIGHVHFADSNRRPVGYGHTPITGIASALRAINYSGYVSAEAFPWPSPVEAARQTISAFKQFFTKE